MERSTVLDTPRHIPSPPDENCSKSINRDKRNTSIYVKVIVKISIYQCLAEDLEWSKLNNVYVYLRYH